MTSAPPSLLLIAALAGAACGDDQATPDGGMADAASGMPDASSGPVTVTVNDSISGVPIGDITVLFNAADGSLVTTVTTDGDGNATAELTAGGSVTAVLLRGEPRFLEVSLQTILAVAPGDHLSVRHTFETTESDLMQLLLPEVEGADLYSVDSACGLGSGKFGAATYMGIEFWCDGVADIVVHARTPAGELRMAFQDQPIVPDSVIDLTGETWTEPDTRTVSVTGLPAGLVNLTLFLTPYEQGRPFASAYTALEPGAGAASADLASEAVGDHVGVSADLERDRPDRSYQSVNRISALEEAEAPLDLDATLLPWLTPPLLRDRRISWSRDGSQEADGGNLSLTYRSREVDGEWTLLIPPDVDEVALPQLPDSVAQALPLSAIRPRELTLIEVSGLDRDSFRQRGLVRYSALEPVDVFLEAGEGMIRTTSAVTD